MASVPITDNYYSPRVPDFYDEAVDYSKFVIQKRRPLHGASSNISGGVSEKQSESSESKKFSPFVGGRGNPSKNSVMKSSFDESENFNNYPLKPKTSIFKN